MLVKCCLTRFALNLALNLHSKRTQSRQFALSEKTLCELRWSDVPPGGFRYMSKCIVAPISKRLEVPLPDKEPDKDPPRSISRMHVLCDLDFVAFDF